MLLIARRARLSQLGGLHRNLSQAHLDHKAKWNQLQGSTSGPSTNGTHTIAHTSQPAIWSAVTTRLLGVRATILDLNSSRGISSSSREHEHEDDAYELEVTSASKRRPTRLINTLEDSFSRFETRIQQSERVNERDFVRTFDLYTQAVEQLESDGTLDEKSKVDLSLMAAILMRCCGKLMYDTSPKVRELLAGNLWQFIKEKNISLDISHYNSLIRVLNENNTFSDPQKILEEISAAGLKPDRVTYQRLIHQYCIQANIDGATKLLEKMKELEMQLNESIFASLIIGYGNQEKPPSMDEIFELMRSNSIEPSGTSYAAAIITLVKSLEKDPNAIAGLRKIHETIEKEDTLFSSSDLTDLVDTLSSKLDQDQTIKQIFERICSSPTRSFSSRYRLMSCLMRNNMNEKASELFWSQKPSQKSIENGTTGLYYIRLLAKTPPEFAIKECSRLKELSYNPKPFHNLYLYAAEFGNLTTARAALGKIAEDAPLKCHYFWPFLAQAKDEASVVHVLKNDITPKMSTAELLDTFSTWVWPKFGDNILRLFELNKELQYDNSLLVASFLNYSVQDKKVQEAIKFISEAPEELLKSAREVPETVEVDTKEQSEDLGLDDDDGQRRRRNDNRPTLVGRLLNQIAEETKDPKVVKKAWSMCRISRNQRSTIEMQPLVKVHLLSNDYKGAIETFLEIAREDRVTPCKSDLMHYCLENKDPENLQKIMNASTEIYGEANSLFDLAICCLTADKVKQAQKIFTSPGFRVNPNRVYRVCQSLSESGKLEALESFVDLAKTMYDVNQDYMYQILLNAYDRTSNGKRALDLWNKMQEEEYQPSKRNLIMIAKVLEKNNIDVPFQKPIATVSSTIDRAVRSSVVS